LLCAAQFVVRQDAQGRNCDIRGNDFIFNSWGEKNVTWDLDDKIAEEICVYSGVRRDRSDFVLEGGSIHVDGEGCVTEAELLRGALLMPDCRLPGT